jgi:hypothetical protein
MSVVYVPAASPEVDGVTVSVPPACASDSHGTVSEALHDRDPAATSSVFAAGDAPLNESDAGVTDRVGTGGGPEQVTGLAMSACSSAADSARL